ncbi:MAG: bifunctional phosphopantothenoylcysteine decarboxylase/phosphopantothenate--cysteine ligase CoaBC, partial [Kiritimatiellaeota bacterium]|nr:bifunctional phosphopantothenoylcysteine decarboxylase/phosphopantothenate--cysteine ligase CoaBC [Kiritimatiellota bacterium]
MATILLGVTGSIAAYKACELTRLFVKDGHDVQVLMTAAAAEFVAPLTFRTLSRNPVPETIFGEPDERIPG